MTVFGISGANWLDLLFGRLFCGNGVCREILSFESTLSVLTGTILLAERIGSRLGNQTYRCGYIPYAQDHL
jgi:hypothetical protein